MCFLVAKIFVFFGILGSATGSEIAPAQLKSNVAAPSLRTEFIEASIEGRVVKVFPVDVESCFESNDRLITWIRSWLRNSDRFDRSRSIRVYSWPNSAGGCFLVLISETISGAIDSLQVVRSDGTNGDSVIVTHDQSFTVQKEYVVAPVFENGDLINVVLFVESIRGVWGFRLLNLDEDRRGFSPMEGRDVVQAEMVSWGNNSVLVVTTVTHQARWDSDSEELLEDTKLSLGRVWVWRDLVDSGITVGEGETGFSEMAIGLLAPKMVGTTVPGMVGATIDESRVIVSSDDLWRIRDRFGVAD